MRSPLLVSYWENWRQKDGSFLPLSQSPTQLDIIAVAFNSNSSVPGFVDFQLGIPGITDAEFLADIAFLKSRGQYVVLSIGGGGAHFFVNTPEAQAEFTSSVYAVIKKWGFDGIDIDLENIEVKQFEILFHFKTLHNQLFYRITKHGTQLFWRKRYMI